MRIKVTTFVLLSTLVSYLHASDFETYLNIGKQLKEEKKYEQALQQFEHALKILPSDSASRLQLANDFLFLGFVCFNELHSETALRAFENILRISQNIPAAHHNVGLTLAERLGRYKEAIAYYQRALSLKQDEIETHFCLAMAYLATGNLINGFKEYEWRWKRPLNKKPRPNLNYPLEQQWTCQDLHKKRIVLHTEQGLGDTLHFIRYAQILKKMGATIIVETQKPLVPLLSLCDYIDEIIPVGKPLPDFDYQVLLVSLAHIFHTSLHTIPRNIPYLRSNPDLTKLWADKIAHDQNFKIGICWYGDPTHSPLKFMPLSYFEQLAQIPGISFYSLQKGKTTGATTNIIFFDDFDETQGSFMDSAALMQSLDLVITVDTSVAHLAGGLGVPVWVALPFPAEWRWLMNRNDSPWYPTMRLFRQEKPGDWQPVFKKIKQNIKELVKK